MHFLNKQKKREDKMTGRMGWSDVETMAEGTEPFPGVYGNKNSYEATAESQAAVHVGGEAAEAIGEERRRAIAEMHREDHSGEAGPRYVTATKIDLDHMPAKLGETLKCGKLYVCPSVTLYREQSPF